MDPLHQELIRQAAEDARAGKRDEARAKLESVLEEDETNIKAWLLLARLTGNPDERRLALKTILEIDPDNETAKKLLSRMEAETTSAQTQVVAGVSQQMVRLVIGGLMIVIIFLLIAIAFIAMNANSQRQARELELTRITLQETMVIATATAAALQLTAEADAMTATQIALVSPTPTLIPTSNLPTLPPTFTATPTVFVGLPTAFPPPQGVSGRLVGWRGRDLGSVDALPVVFYNLAGPDAPPVQIGEHMASDVDIDSQGRLLYRRYRQSLSQWELQIVDFQGNPVQTTLDVAGQFHGYSAPGAARFTPDGSRVVFAARSFETAKSELFMVVLSGELINGESVIRLTNDPTGAYSYPDISSDGRQVVAVRTDPEEGVDLVVIDVETRLPSRLTTDGNTTLETMPRWSPNDSLIAYAAATPDARRNHDIFLITPQNPGSGFRLIDDPQDAIYPVFSPDGNFLAFSSRRTGFYNIFIWDLVNQTLFQLTNDQEEDYPGGWTN